MAGNNIHERRPLGDDQWLRGLRRNVGRAPPARPLVRILSAGPLFAPSQSGKQPAL